MNFPDLSSLQNRLTFAAAMSWCGGMCDDISAAGLQIEWSAMDDEHKQAVLENYATQRVIRRFDEADREMP